MADLADRIRIEEQSRSGRSSYDCFEGITSTSGGKVPVAVNLVEASEIEEKLESNRRGKSS